jgi:uncharacterized glyoxalase superfamily protein PhnB
MPKIERVIPLSTYGQREYHARDPEGHRWWFMMPLNARR